MGTENLAEFIMSFPGLKYLKVRMCYPMLILQFPEIPTSAGQAAITPTSTQNWFFFFFFFNLFYKNHNVSLKQEEELN